MEPYRRLFVIRDNEVRPISWPGDLKGLVDLSDEQQAQAFLRLFSSLDNAVKFPSYPFMELRPGYEIAQDHFREYGLVTQQLVRQGSDFRILRSVAILDRTKRSLSLLGLAILDETVTHDGGYYVRVLWEARDLNEYPGIRLPAYR